MKNNKYNKKKVAVAQIETKQRSEKLRNNTILGFILALTFFLFIKVQNFQFVNWDDNSYIQSNMMIRDFSLAGLAKIFSTPVIGMYNPLAFLVYTFIYKFWGMNSGAFHMFNLFFHLVATIAAFRFILELTRRYEAAAIVALFFAVHPMHVSIVTWVSELKTSLYCIFYFYAMVSYIRYVRNDYRVRNLLYTGLLFVLALLSKPSAVTLPPMLFLLDYYLSRKMDKRLFLEKIPFFALSLFFGILTILTHVEAEDSIFEANHNYSLINNILVSNYSIVFYINKLFAPLELCTIYPYPANTEFLPFKYYFSILVIPFLCWLVYKAGKFRKEMIFGLLYFLIAISVLLRIVPSGFFRASNVYSYMSYTGLFFIVAQFFVYVVDNRFSFSNKIKTYVITLVVVLAAFYTWRATIRIAVWENSITLFNDIILKKPTLALAWNNRALSKLDLGDVAGAVADLNKSIELDPNYAVARNNRAKIFVDFKEYDAALNDLTIALKLDTDYAEAFINRGNVNFYQQKMDQALADYNMAIKCNPDIEVVYKNRSKIEVERKEYDKALADLNKAISLNPDYVDAYIDKGNLMIAQSKYNEAIVEYNSAIRINPNSRDAYNNRSYTKMLLGDTLSASQDAAKAASLTAQMQQGTAESPPASFSSSLR